MFQLQANDLRPEEIVFLFEQNFTPKNDDEDSLNLTQETFELAWPLAKELFLGAAKHLGTIDQDIAEASVNWSVDRMSQVDLALLRLAYYEMRYKKDVPPRVSLNEAIEIAKNFGDIDSSSFINGILDKLLTKADKKSTNKPKKQSSKKNE
jgi:N utilization substance protein B